MSDQVISLIVQIIVPIIVTSLASSGFWLFLMSSREKRTMQTELLIGLAHGRIVELGMKYITRGWITQDEYEDLNLYLYKPYEKLGGNGSVRRIMLEVDKLPIKRSIMHDKLTGETIP